MLVFLASSWTHDIPFCPPSLLTFPLSISSSLLGNFFTFIFQFNKSFFNSVYCFIYFNNCIYF